ncbi:MAG: hypothetical protein ACI8RA_001678 [Chlamydiales bacterium]|jgi:hypothetical protein
MRTTRRILMSTKPKYIDGSELVRFDLDIPVKTNFNAYQDAIARHPESTQQLKLRYDQYLKTVPLHTKDMAGSEEDHSIEFGIAE